MKKKLFLVSLMALFLLPIKVSASVNQEAAINHMYELQQEGTSYSMYGSRTGMDGTADCSGSVYASLRSAGASNLGYVPSTETLHNWLLQNGYELITENQPWQAQRGDITIWGHKGYSYGAGGHVGIWTSHTNWIECTAWNGAGIYGGIVEDSHDWRWGMRGMPYYYTYRQRSQMSQSASASSTPENGTFTPNTVVNVRSASSTSAAVVAQYDPGQAVYYDGYTVNEGYVWIHYISYSGEEHYMAVRQVGQAAWGVFD
ncbi:peptidoglycan amidohydrolase family protein [Enterococcus faecium]